MSKKETPNDFKLTVWQSIRDSIVSWDSASKMPKLTNDKYTHNPNR